ncbi:hypothetical protein SAMN05216266_110207 [Amycolatopsis marina]|uniref:PRC-barrel domain-containing protein n=1 Tax=Amycolatopsis marina TaxID=490629 RepID=A0A1I1AUR3_9PSEU|nr:hypothetical protein [Amycolatopsis marina]SFB41819.1 hypothetical protein SAMN05216266_110207 [Amycolatopsis marina]
MRVGELLGTPILDADGRRRGVVIEVRTRAEGGTGGEAALVVDGLVLATHRWRLFGYERRDERGPAVLRAVLRLVHRHTRYAGVDEVDIDAGSAVHLRESWDALRSVHDIPH